jgi:hypothetical protein
MGHQRCEHLVHGQLAEHFALVDQAADALVGPERLGPAAALAGVEEGYALRSLAGGLFLGARQRQGQLRRAGRPGDPGKPELVEIPLCVGDQAADRGKSRNDGDFGHRDALRLCWRPGVNGAVGASPINPVDRLVCKKKS